ncbi:MAG TPA: hypothetical protein VF292_08720, partial [Rhodanobacteraceae bacterium]
EMAQGGGSWSCRFTQVIEVTVMRKYLSIAAVAMLGTLGLAACSHSSGQAESSAEPAKVSKPAAGAVAAAVKACLVKHPGAAAPASATSAAPRSAPASAKASGSAPASGASSAPSLASSGSGSTENPCARSSIAASVWQPYLQQVVTSNMDGISNTPFVYFVPSSEYPENAGPISRVQGQVDDVVAATVLPGNMVAVAGPNSATSAQVVETAFKSAASGSFKGVVVLFIGDQADEAAVQKAVTPSGATFKFVQM